MVDRQRMGGWAGLLTAATFVVGFVMAATVLSDYTTGDPTPAESVAFVADHQTALWAWHVVIFVLFGLALVPLVLALHARLAARAPVLAQTATAFGLIWAALVLASGMIAIIGLGTVQDLYETDPARAEPVWSAIDSVQTGLGGGVEIVGGLWVLLTCLAALQLSVLPRALCAVGLLAGAAGVVTTLPGLEDVGAVFGVGMIVWFAWTGVRLLRDAPATGPLDGPAQAASAGSATR